MSLEMERAKPTDQLRARPIWMSGANALRLSARLAPTNAYDQRVDMSLLSAGDKKVVIDLSKVTYVNSATIGCLMDLYRQSSAAGSELRLAGVNKRVETMLTMTGAHNFLKMYPDEAGALQSFGS